MKAQIPFPLVCDIVVDRLFLFLGHEPRARRAVLDHAVGRVSNRVTVIVRITDERNCDIGDIDQFLGEELAVLGEQDTPVHFRKCRPQIQLHHDPNILRINKEITQHLEALSAKIDTARLARKYIDMFKKILSVLHDAVYPVDTSFLSKKFDQTADILVAHPGKRMIMHNIINNDVVLVFEHLKNLSLEQLRVMMDNFCK